jgi:hypothetical protein
LANIKNMEKRITKDSEWIIIDDDYWIFDDDFDDIP